MTLHPSPITCEFLFSTALISPKMCLSHLENMPLSHSRTQGAQRSSWKLWLFCSIVMLLFLCSFSWLIFIFLQLETAKEPCMAKFGLLKFAEGPLQTLFAWVSPAEAAEQQRLLPVLPSGSFVPVGHQMAEFFKVRLVDVVLDSPKMLGKKKCAAPPLLLACCSSHVMCLLLLYHDCKFPEAFLEAKQMPALCFLYSQQNCETIKPLSFINYPVSDISL
nr:tumor necrosis factor ligand superfamily member 4 isoform X1 [Pan paniscus]